MTSRFLERARWLFPAVEYAHLLRKDLSPKAELIDAATATPGRFKDGFVLISTLSDNPNCGGSCLIVAAGSNQAYRGTVPEKS